MPSSVNALKSSMKFMIASAHSLCVSLMPALGRQRQDHLCNFGESLVYITSSRPDRMTHWNPVSRWPSQESLWLFFWGLCPRIHLMILTREQFYRIGGQGGKYNVLEYHTVCGFGRRPGHVDFLHWYCVKQKISGCLRLSHLIAYVAWPGFMLYVVFRDHCYEVGLLNIAKFLNSILI